MNEIQPITLLNFPDEILLKILENLSSTYIGAVRQTCSRLYNLCNSREIMKNQKFVIPGTNSKQMEKRLNTITESKMNFLNLELDMNMNNNEFEEIGHILIKALRSSGTKINSLIFKSMCHVVNFAVIHEVLISCVNLNTLGFRGGFDIINWPKQFQVRPDHVNTKLETLIFNNCYNFTDLMVNFFLDFFPAIKTLELYLPNVSYSSIVTRRFYKNFEQPSDDVLTADFLIHKITTCNKYIEKLIYVSFEHGFTKQQFQKLFILSDLRLKSLHYTGKFVVSEMEFKNLVSKHDLTEFKLRLCEKFNSKCLQHLLRHCPNLQRLHLKYLPYMYFMDVAEVSSQMGLHLKIFEYHNNVLFVYPSSCTDLIFPNLEHLSLRLHPYEIDIVCLRNCSNLKYLIMDQLNATSSNKDIIPFISASQNTLVNLELHNFEYKAEQSDVDSKMPSHLFFPNLEVLKIDVSKDLTSPIVGNFNFPSLKKLTIGRDYFIQEQDYELMMDGCPLLEYLSFHIQKPMKKNDLLSLGYSWRFLKKSKFTVLG